MTEEIINPNEHLIIPDWINVKYFDKVLKQDQPDYVEVLKFTPVAAIPPGENFTSTMLRIYIDLKLKDGTTKTKTYIFKTMLPSDRGGKDMQEMGLFDKELLMYQKFLPAFEDLYKEAGWNDIQLAPKCLLTEVREGNIHFIFEDLCVKNFKNVDRIKGLDMVHMERALHKLAEFHAASAVYADKNGPYPKEFDSGFVVPTEKVKEFLSRSFKVKELAYQNGIKSCGLPNTQIEKYIKDFPNAEQYWALALSSLEVDPNDFNVLIHGDFWSSNLMCNYHKDGSIDQLILVDFQIGKWGSPAQDLLFFIILSAANDIRLKEFDNFVRIYWERLVECLKVLNFKKPLPQLRDLQAAMYKKNNSFYAFFALTNHLPIILFPTDKDSNLHSLSAETEEAENLRMRLLSNPAYGKVLKDLYPFFYNRGFLNFGDFEE
ncbi:uncharacterized protein Dwil_GK14337 [Drosophila willistoni]|uniref:CHK kinase-like domain-containing protein n=2 Tax=Drosophila willistoni TaxID=7260 RepID=B4NIL0_DROWI|nr:uncharacterized protein Dwil_GK14337 [Drosophila willistoni]